MRALLAITARELRERWTLLFAMFCAGFVVLLVPAMRLDVRALPTAVLLMVPAAWVLAVLMGGSVIARDLADGRLGFFFSRPVAWWAIAGGKLLAALLLTLGAATAGVLPALVADWSLSRYAGEFWQLLAGGGIMLMLALLLALVGLGHVASVVYRSRSVWAAADFLLLAASAIGGALLLQAFKRLGVVMTGAPPSAWGLVLTLLLIALVPLSATAAQMALGRSDLRLGHVALSVTFWSGVLLWFAALGGLLVRELAVAPAALASRAISGTAPDGRLIGIVGLVAPNRQVAFLLDTTSGHFLRQGMGSRPAFSADGHHVAWIEETPFWHHDRVTEVQLARLDGTEFAIETVELAAWLPPDGIVGLALSPQADRLAIAQNATLSVHELPSGRTLSQSAAADGDWMAATFLPDGQLRAFRRVRAALGPSGIVPGRVEVVAMSGGVPSSAIRLEAVGHAILISPPGEDLVLLLESLAPRRVSLHDARTGERLRAFSGEEGFQVTDACLLEKGRVAVVETKGPSTRLRLAEPGRPDRLVTLPEGSGFVGGELPGGLVAVGRFVPGARFVPGFPPSAGRETLFISWGTGELVATETDAIPARGQLQRSSRGAATQLLWSGKGELLHFDPTTRQRRVLLAAPPPPR